MFLAANNASLREALLPVVFSAVRAIVKYNSTSFRTVGTVGHEKMAIDLANLAPFKTAPKFSSSPKRNPKTRLQSRSRPDVNYLDLHPFVQTPQKRTQTCPNWSILRRKRLGCTQGRGSGTKATGSNRDSVVDVISSSRTDTTLQWLINVGGG